VSPAWLDRKQRVPVHGAAKGKIANGCRRDSNGIAKFDLTVHASILLHIVAHLFHKVHEDAA
jgi:hypothetical protein